MGVRLDRGRDRVAALGALLLTGCLLPLSQEAASPANRCRAEVECGAGAVCVEGRCVADQARTTVVFAASPPSGPSPRTVVSTALAPREVSSSSRVQISLARARTVRGSVHARRAGMDGLVPANVQFARVGPGAQGEAPVTVFSSATLDATAGFTVSLPAGTYTVVVEPRDLEALPPMVLTSALTVTQGDPGDVQSFDIAYSEPLQVTGFVVDRDAGAGLGELFVRAVDAEGRAVSTLGKTTTGTGAFSIGLSPQASRLPWSLEVSTGATDASQRGREETASRLVYRIERGALQTTSGLQGAQVRISGLARLGQTTEGICVGCVPLEATVETGEGRAVGNASVVVFSALGGLPAGHSAWFAVNTTTTSSGTLTAAVLPGDYTAIITPSDEESAVTRVSFSVATMLRGPVFRVTPRAVLQGHVRAALAQSIAMGGVSVRAIPLREAGPEGASAPTITPRAAEVSTAQDGSYTLRLDPGRYVLLAQPSEGSGFAATIDPVLLDLRDGRDPMRRDLSLSAPIALRGVVLDPLGQPVEQATVTAFARIPYALASGRPSTIDVALSRVESAPGGVFESLLPPNLVSP